MAINKYVSINNLSKFLDSLKNIFATKIEVDAKSDKTHGHNISDISGLQASLNNKAESSHGAHVEYSTASPLMDGTAAVGVATTVSRSDHRHPIDTSRASQISLDSHISNTTSHITSDERTNFNAGYTHSKSAHAPSNAEKNQNAFSNVTVGSTVIAADSTTDTITLVAGTNVTITPDATNDKITISAKDTTYSLSSFGITATASELNKLDGVTATSTELNYVDGVTSNIQTQLDGKAASSHTHKVANISDLTVTATELNYMDGVTDNVQTQLDNKASISHNHAASNITSGTLSSDRLPTIPIAKGGTGATTASGVLTNLGITATASELNYVDGVTSNIQTQLNGKASNSHTHNYLSISGGNLTGTLGIGNKYELSPAYNYTNGCLIDIGAAKSSTMVVIHITGNSYNSSTLPINSLFQFYDYGDGTIMNYSGVNLGLSLGAMTAYRHNNRLYAYIKQTASYQTLSFTIVTNKSGLTPTVINNAAHTSGYSDLVNINPKNVALDGHTHNYAGSSSAGGAATSAIKATQDANGNVITSTYATKTELNTAKSGLQTSINGKANSSHTHTIANITNLQTTLDEKSNTSHTHNYAGSSSAGGSATSAVKLDTSTAGDSNTPVYFSGGKPVACTSLDLNTSGSSASCTGNSATATKLSSGRTISLTGDVTGSVSFDGSTNVSIAATVVDDSHNHIISNIDGLQSALDGKSATSHNHNSNYISKSLQFTADNGAHKLSYTKDSGKNILTEIAALSTGFYTVYSQSGTAGNPKTTEAWRFMVHKTGATTGWVQGYGSLGSVYSNYIDGDSGWRGWRCIWDNDPNPLWSGAIYMTSTDSNPQTVTPSKKLSECRTGWLLLWSDYDPGDKANDSDFVTTMIPKNNPSGGTWGGKSFLCDIPRYIGSNVEDVDTERRIIKVIYVHDDCIKGSYQGSYDERNDVVLRAVFEF